MNSLMNTRRFAGLDTDVSEVGLGAWQLGGSDWGDMPRERALAILEAAADSGVTCFDTADVYGLGRSETLIGEFLRNRADSAALTIASKLGRGPEPGGDENLAPDVIRRHLEASLTRLGRERLDLIQTHCISHAAMQQGEVFSVLRGLRDEGLIRAFGASVESMDEALTCLDVEGLSSLQIIFNIFRQKPIKVLFERAKARQVAVIVRLPLASGLLAGKFATDTHFADSDHRHYNQDGAAFNVGETFAGLGLKRGAGLADELKSSVPAGMDMATMALRWCLDYDAVTTIIPGASSPEQARANAAVSALPPLSEQQHEALRGFYRDRVAQHIRGPY